MSFVITGYVIANGMVRVTTDHAGRNEFVYKSDKFPSIVELRAEIARSVSLESARSAAAASRVQTLRDNFDAELVPIIEVTP